MGKIHFHIDEVDWKTFSTKEWGPLRWKELLNREQGGSKEFVFGVAELPPGGKLPLHTHPQAETDYILSGHGRIRIGPLKSVGLGPASAVYLIGEAPHSIESFGPEPLRYLYTYACEKLGHTIELKLIDEGTEIRADIQDWIKSTRKRWVMHEEIGELLCFEPSKGYKVRGRRLFSLQHANAREMKVGMFEMDPGIHYTLHYHDQPEIFYVVSGRGIFYAGNSALEAIPGVVFYVGSRVVHGADNLGEGLLRMYYLYGTETVGQESNWTPIEDVYTQVRRPK